MNGLIDRYMDDETIRIFCFFVKNKYHPLDECCKNCARKKLCERDAVKLIKFVGFIPWLDIDELLEREFGKQRCKTCDLI